MSQHENRMIRHPLVFRTAHVLRVETLTPHMRRIVLGGPALRGFDSPAADDHVKLFFPNGSGEITMPAMAADGLMFPENVEPSPAREYTPRHYDPSANELTIDFVLHSEGPATLWAQRATPGQELGVAGPRGSFVPADDFDTYVIVGDETALPAIGRWLEEMPAHHRVQALIEIPEAGDRQALPESANVQIRWLERNGQAAADSRLLEEALRQLPASDGDAFYWIATESKRTRNMRKYLEEERGLAADWIRAKAYWKSSPED
ncbi:MAG: siderophore-interacting protein [Xanthomonadaceae bacterium]|jgi:NADPH-dependent ferric siderophore reductase|nr:siderophore-interacting protein [Xanthomonadaceae bacterium]